MADLYRFPWLLAEADREGYYATRWDQGIRVTTIAATQKQAFKAAVAVVGKTKQANTYWVGSLTGPIEPACTCITTEGDPT